MPEAPAPAATALPARAAELVRRLGLVPHPEGGHYREVFRSPATVTPGDGRPPRSALTHIDFLLAAGGFSAWHRVASDEVWQLLEGSPLRLWLLPPALDRVQSVQLAPVGATDGAEGAEGDEAGLVGPRHVVPAGWWQAAEPAGPYSYVGATVGPGFDFADFAFGRDDAALGAALSRLAPQLRRLL